MVRPMGRGVLFLAILLVGTGLLLRMPLALSDDAEAVDGVAGSEPAALFQTNLPEKPDAHSGLPLRRSLRERFVNEAIQRSLQKKISIEFTDAPLVETLTNLAKEHHLPLWVDKAALINEGIKTEELLVTLRLADVSVQSVLRLICEPFQLTWIVEDDALVVTTSTSTGCEAANETRVYDVGRLLFQNDVDDLIDSLTSCVRPDSWDEVGGSGSVRSMKDPLVIVIRQAPSVHAEIGALLRELQQHVEEPAGKANPAQPQDRRASVREKLTESCDVEADDLAFDRVIARLASQQAIPLWIDHHALQEEGVRVDQPVTIHLEGIRIESALRLMLKPLGLAFVVEDEILKITTGERAAGSLSTRVYNVRDLARPFELAWPPKPGMPGAAPPGLGLGGGMFQMDETPRRPLVLRGGFGFAHGGQGGWFEKKRRMIREFDLEELINVITSTIHSDSWDEVGGSGSVGEFRNTLIVHQTDSVHAEIGELLRNLRMIKRRAEQKPLEEKSPDEMKRTVYDLSGFDYPPANLAQIIPDLVAPSTWQTTNQGGKATLHAQPHSLVITQTRANHAEIVKLLYQVVLKIEE